METLIRLGSEFHRRGWVLGTSGNFSVVVSRDPLRLWKNSEFTVIFSLTGNLRCLLFQEGSPPES